MLPKAKAIEDAIRGGVRRVHVMSYKSAKESSAEVFTNEGAGTLDRRRRQRVVTGRTAGRQVGVS
jgi:acetylglutamate kinase